MILGSGSRGLGLRGSGGLVWRQCLHTINEKLTRDGNDLYTCTCTCTCRILWEGIWVDDGGLGFRGRESRGLELRALRP